LLEIAEFERSYKVTSATGTSLSLARLAKKRRGKDLRVGMGKKENMHQAQTRRKRKEGGVHSWEEVFCILARASIVLPSTFTHHKALQMNI
jgi:hypothetical protein